MLSPFLNVSGSCHDGIAITEQYVYHDVDLEKTRIFMLSQKIEGMTFITPTISRDNGHLRSQSMADVPAPFQPHEKIRNLRSFIQT
jgi:hypothetical protein